MRRAKLQPRTIYPILNKSPSQDGQTEDKRIRARQGPLPHIGEKLVAPPPGKPEHSHQRRIKPKPGVQYSKSQSQTSPDTPAAPTPAPAPRGREEPYLSYKDFITKKPSNTQQNVNFPDIRDRKGQISRRHLHIRPANKELTLINEIANEPARRPYEPTPPNGRASRTMVYYGRDRTPTGELSNENTHKVNKAKIPVPPPGPPPGQLGSHARLPPLDKILKRRGTMKKNFLYD